MRTSKEYVKKLYRMRKNVYMDGKLIGRDDPQLAKAINVMSKTFPWCSSRCRPLQKLKI